MNIRTRIFPGFSLFLLIFAAAVFVFKAGNEEKQPIYTATINRDCAPWDGAAFVTLVPISDQAVITISIYRSPELKIPIAFSFPDQNGSTGNAVLNLQDGSFQELSGRVSFVQVMQENPVEGEFALHTKGGRQWKGRFIAEWENKIVLCG